MERMYGSSAITSFEAYTSAQTIRLEQVRKNIPQKLLLICQVEISIIVDKRNVDGS